MWRRNSGHVRRRRHLFAFVFLLFAAAAAASPLITRLLGVSPQDENYFSGSSFSCKDGSKTVAIDRLNDGFCDCPDGTDEPGTAACPESKFYCRNVGDTPRFLFSSRVNDRICDCCDGSDEYDEGIKCPNTCRGDHGVSGDQIDFKLAGIDNNNVYSNKSKIDLEELFQKLRGLKVLMIIELVAGIFMVYFCLFCRRIRSRRRHLLLQK